MTNENRKAFLKNQRELKFRYLGGTRDNRTEATSDPDYNNRSDTDISPGAEGRSIMEQDE
ncbi:hypothetical protein [Cytobacillus massiliigabonensis]|uniref:hypothetical protein n=1 Tax=Cytobacillus massiliigabonensis TaxID=1871011 RepID=UPI000C847BF5|nr:hypothetical protein [Cytobacillus massiliigabonensis]